MSQPPDAPERSPGYLDFTWTVGSLSSDPPSGDLEVPEHLGEFRILREIARGGMGVVFEAEQTEPRRRVAVKVLPGTTSRTVIARFQREAEALAALHHSGIVNVYAAGVEGNLRYYAMELLEGTSLDGLLQQADRDGLFQSGRKTDSRTEARRRARSFREYLEQAVEHLMQAARAVQHAHDSGVIHRDLKPENVVVEKDGRVVVLDFGLARVDQEDSLTLSSDVFGTPAYMSPEQIREARAVDGRTDVYALGVILFEMLSGRSPYAGSSVLDTLERVQAGRRPSLLSANPVVPRDLATIIEKAMDWSAEERYQSAGELADDLDRFLAGETVQARPLSGTRKLSRWVSRNRLVTALSAGLVLTTAALPLLWGLRRAETRADLLADGLQLVSLWQQCRTGVCPHTGELSLDTSQDPCFRQAEARLTDLLVHYGGDPEAAAALFRLRLDAARDAEAHGLPPDTVDAYYAQAAAVATGDDAALIARGDTSQVKIVGLGSRSARLVPRGLDPTPLEVDTTTSTWDVRSGLWVLETEDLRLPFVAPRWGTVSVVVPPPPGLPPGFLLIAGGPALLGATHDELRDHPDADPLRREMVESFALARNEVTVGEFDRFLRAQPEGLRERFALATPLRDPSRSARGVSLDAARAYAQWRSDREGLPFRLPTSSEWEKAGRNIEAFRYPWGHERRGTAPDESIYGVEDLASGAAEWTAAGLLAGRATGQPPGPALLFERWLPGEEKPSDAGIRLALDLVTQ